MPGLKDQRVKVRLLDYELMFALYLRLGSYGKVSARLQTEGCVSPRTDKPFTRAAVMAVTKRSLSWKEYWKRRDENPDLSDSPTPEEYEAAARVIAERLPLQRKMIEEVRKMLKTETQYAPDAAEVRPVHSS